MRTLCLALASLLLTSACGGGAPATSTTTTTTTSPDADHSRVVSWDILAREPVSNEAAVKHILISWKELAPAFRGSLDPRAEARTKADAEDTITELMSKLTGGADFDELMAETSEDLGSARSGKPIAVDPAAGLVIEFRQLSLRLAIGELGVCQSDFGFHIIKRVS